MSSAQEKILNMVAAGKVSAAEGDELLKALRPEEPSFWRFVFQPASRLGLGASLALGAGASVGMLMLSRLGVAFDGAVDVHVQPAAVSWPVAVAQVFIAWPLVTLVFWLTARIAGKPCRLMDMLGAVGIARLAFLLVGLTTLPLKGLELTRVPHATEFVAILGGLLLLIWAFTLLCTGFRTVTGLRQGRLAGSFIAALVVAEVCSKLLLALIP
jgi:hypothetical protein